MTAEKTRVVDAIDQLDTTLSKLSGLVRALEHLMDGNPSLIDAAHPMHGAFFAVWRTVEAGVAEAGLDIDRLWDAARPIVGRRARHA